MGVFVFGERPKPVHVLAISLAVIAVLVQLFAYGSLPWVSLTLALSFALYGAIRKQINSDSMQGLFLESLCMAPFAALWILTHDGSGMGEHGLKVDLFLLCAGAFTAAPLLTYVAATRILPLSTIGLLTYVGPSIQLIVAIFVLMEPVTSVTVLTFGLVWLGVLAVSIEAGYSARKLQKLKINWSSNTHSAPQTSCPTVRYLLHFAADRINKRKVQGFRSADRPFTALLLIIQNLTPFKYPTPRDRVLQLNKTSSNQQDGVFSDDKTLGAVSTRLEIHA